MRTPILYNQTFYIYPFLQRKNAKNKPKNREHKWMFSTVFCGTPSIQAYFYFEPQAQFPKVLYFRTNIFQVFFDTVPFSLDTWEVWSDPRVNVHTSASLNISNVYIDQRAIPVVWSERVNEIWSSLTQFSLWRCSKYRFLMHKLKIDIVLWNVVRTIIIRYFFWYKTFTLSTKIRDNF